MAFKVYTKTGDKGQTSLFGGKRLPKHHLRIESYGTVDELNSFIGLVRDGMGENEFSEERTLLKEIQIILFDIGASLASDPEKKLLELNLSNQEVEVLEKEIDRMDEILPALKNFILPGGSLVVSHCHLARCVCRRAERNVVALAENEEVEPLLVSYLNRLSDYL
ncbi:MAG: cob(I)yrinic acid a,c-diamide adenosyltransferase, partial [Saprospiraceae bacterium]